MTAQWIDLYPLSFTGCPGCFQCKRKKFYGQCPISDGLYNLIPAVCDGEAIRFSCPVYFAKADAYTRCYIKFRADLENALNAGREAI